MPACLPPTRLWDQSLCSYVSTAVIEHQGQRQLGEERVHLVYSSQSIIGEARRKL